MPDALLGPEGQPTALGAAVREGLWGRAPPISHTVEQMNMWIWA